MLKNAFSMVEQLGKIGNNLSNAEQQQIRAFIDVFKKSLKANDIAEQIFIGKVDTKLLGDNSFDGTDALHYPKDEYRQYWLLRESFNLND